MITLRNQQVTEEILWSLQPQEEEKGWAINSLKAVREKGNLQGSKRQLQAQALEEEEQLRQPQC